MKIETIADYSPACKVYLYRLGQNFVCGGCQLEDERIFKTSSSEVLLEHVQAHRDHNQPVPKRVDFKIRQTADAMQ